MNGELEYRRRRWWARGPVVALVVWLIGMAYWYFRPALWILDLPAIALAVVLCVAGLVGFAVSLARIIPVTVVALPVAVMIAVTAGVSGWWMVSPRGWFAAHRVLYNAASSIDPGVAYYGRTLPPHLRFLAVNGRVSGNTAGTRFFPQWIGVPDDAGGYLYAPSGTPAGYDMYGMACTAPVSLGGGWWMCGMRSN